MERHEKIEKQQTKSTINKRKQKQKTHNNKAKENSKKRHINSVLWATLLN